MLKASHGASAQAYDYKRDRLLVPFPVEEMKYLTFSSSPSDNGANRRVKFCHSIHNAYKIQVANLVSKG